MRISLARSLKLPPLLAVVACCLIARAQTPELPRITEPPREVPYHWNSVSIVAGGFVSGLLFNPGEKGLVYARTDVGGAYRSQDSGDHWVSITDQFGRDEASYLGIESMAIDPNDANKIYLAAGMYSADWGGPAAILRSSDKGRTYEKTMMPFKMGGNDNGRGCGERLAVDPNLSSTLYFGSRKAGLWKSLDSGVTWTKVVTFPLPDKLSGVGENTGITFVVFDASTGAKGTATPVIYAGVAMPGAGLYRSRDAGATWEPVAGVPKDLFPNHAVFDRGKSIYFSFVDNVGPNGITDGSIQRFTPEDGKWKDITPVRPGTPGQGGFGYGGIALDAEHPETLMVTTIDRWGPGDTAFRTTDAGKHWKDVLTNVSFYAPSAPWAYRHRDVITKTHWMNDIKIDPFDSAKVMFTSGEGIWGSADVTSADSGKQPHWGFPNQGLEEVVPLSIISPPTGAPLLSAVGDLGGFRHEDVRKSPPLGSFTGPLLGTNTSIDFAQTNPNIVARVGSGDSQMIRGGYSLDNGVTWKPYSSEPPSSTKGGGVVAVSADGKTVVWSPDNAMPYWSSDWGRNWTGCGGLTEKTRVVSDRVNPLKFYSFNDETGQLLESLDGARSFGVRTEPVAPVKGRWARLAVNPVKEGDLWISANRRTFHSADSGITFVELLGMTNVQALGFGKPAPGRTEPTLYMNGTAAGQEGTFRSDDGGLSWLRIDDAQHQFGWKNALIGDPRIFGRVYLATGGRGILYGDPAQ